jgi:predicted Zn-dependent peptidase
MKKIASFLTFFSLCLSSPLKAGEYTPEGLYDITRHKLSNGLEVYLKERHESKSTSIRLSVNYGADDNECGKTETAHYLEHLLFTGTSKHTERELDDIIEDNGGYWNAGTGAEDTTYEIDIYSKYTELALTTLHEILTESTISDDNVKTTLDIINREAGGSYSWFSRYLYTLNIGKSGFDKASEVLFAEDEYCPIIESFEDIHRDDIVTAFKKFYVPNNMALIIVGDFDSESILNLIEQTFGRMSANETNHVRASGEYSYPPQDTFSGTLNPIRGNDAEAYVRYRIPGRGSDDEFIFSLLSLYLSEDLYNSIRIDKGLSYSASASISKYENYGSLELYADSEIENLQTVTDLMLSEVENLQAAPISQDKFDRIKRGLLLGYASSFQSNSDIASYYASVWPDLLNINKFIQLEQVLQKITPEDIHRVAKKYLGREKALISHESPTLTHEETYITIGVLLLLTVFSIRRRIIKYKRT